MDQSGSYTVEQFIEDIEHNDILNMDEYDKCFNISRMLSKVTNELEYKREILKNKIDNVGDSGIIDGYGDTSVILRSTENYSIRIVKWLPENLVPSPDLERSGLAYQIAHNHDFNLITKGVYGSGYQTDLYDFQADRVAGAIGEKVKLKYNGRFQLQLGSVIWYRRCFDVHVQVPPSDFSISFNVIPKSRNIGYGQFIFDIEENEIINFARNGVMRSLSCISLISSLYPNEKSYGIVEEAIKYTDSEWLKIALCMLIKKHWPDRFEGAFDRYSIQDSFYYSADFDPARFSANMVR